MKNYRTWTHFRLREFKLVTIHLFGSVQERLVYTKFTANLVFTIKKEGKEYICVYIYNMHNQIRYILYIWIYSMAMLTSIVACLQ